MKVEMNIAEKSAGLLLKKTFYRLEFSVSFDVSEKDAIKKLGLGDYAILQQPPASAKDAEMNEFQFPGCHGNKAIWVKRLLNGKQQSFDYELLLEAQKAMEDLKENLTNLKGALSRANTPNSERFEI